MSKKTTKRYIFPARVLGEDKTLMLSMRCPFIGVFKKTDNEKNSNWLWRKGIKAKVTVEVESGCGAK